MNPLEREELDYELERLDREDEESGFYQFLQLMLCCVGTAVILGMLALTLYYSIRN